MSETPSAQFLRVSDNHRFLVAEDGAPFFWLGDTAWDLFHRLDKKETEYYLHNRADKGFTVIQCVLLAEFNGLDDPTPEGHLPLIDLDPTQPNEAYFKHVDWVVEKAAEFGIYLALLPTWGSNLDEQSHPTSENHKMFNEENAGIYGEYLGTRYRDKWNVLWVLGGDRIPVNNEKIWTAMARGLERGDAGKHLKTYHVPGEHSSSEYWHNADWLDFNMLQSGHVLGAFSDNYSYVQKDYNKAPTKPTLDSEALYEAMPIGFIYTNGRATAHHIRANAYWAVFAGAFGHTYGHDSVFQFYDAGRKPSFWAEMYWRQALDSPGAAQMQHLKNLMLSRPFLTRIPDQSIFEPEPDKGASHIQGTRDGHAGVNDATFLMVYYPYVTWTNKINTRVIASDSLKAWWYDPRTGTAFSLGTFENEGLFDLTWNPRLDNSQGGPDWVLVIDDATKNYPPPGTPLH